MVSTRLGLSSFDDPEVLEILEPGARVELATLLITNPGPEPTQEDQENPTERTDEPPA